MPIVGVGLCAVVPAGIVSAPVADEPTTPLDVMVVAVIVVGVVEPNVPFNAPVAGPARPVVPSKIIDIANP
jgi:hypothetical protein